MEIKYVLERTGRVLLGYAGAVVVATFGALSFAPFVWFSPMFLVACSITAMAAAIPMFVYVLITELRCVWPGKWGHVLAGSITAIAAHAISYAMGPDPFIHTPQVFFFSIFGGGLGGLAYWAIAVRRIQVQPVSVGLF